MTTAPRPLAVGDTLHGRAHGVFGDQHYHCARIEQVGPDWIVARQEPGDSPLFAAGRQQLALLQDARDQPCDHGCPRTTAGPPLTTWTPR